MKIYTSIDDFSPLFRGPEYLFRGLASCGVDGVEVVLGFKSRWSIDKYLELSKKYKLPIVSAHQPLWSGLGIYFDWNFIEAAKKLGARQVVCHPLPKISLHDSRSQAYFKKLSDLQESSGVKVLIENLPQKYDNRLLNFFFPPKQHPSNIDDLRQIAKTFGFGLTLDIDHLQLSAPHEAPWFSAALSNVGNIHLSSFGNDKRHLPIYMGELRTVEFIEYLKQSHYRGQLTFEIKYPRAITGFTYDFKAIKKSVESLGANVS